MNGNFHNDFSECYNGGDYKAANIVLLTELGKLLATNKSDFVHLLNECGIPSDNTTPNEELINQFIESVGSNNRLALGAALLINMHNRPLGFDGDEILNDNSVKASYFMLHDNFSAADGDGGGLLNSLSQKINSGGGGGAGSSGGGVAASIAQGIGALAGLGTKIAEGQQKKKYGALDALVQKNQAKAVMQQAAAKVQQQQIAATAKSKSDAARKTRIIWISVASLAGLLIIGGIIYYVKTKRK